MAVNYIIIGCVCYFMYGAAESGKRRGWLWGLITLLWVVLIQNIFGEGLLTALAGFLGAFVTMTIANYIKDPSRDS